MPRFNHTYDFAFDVQSNSDDGDDVTPEMLVEAIWHRTNRIVGQDKAEMIEACGLIDSTEEPDHAPEKAYTGLWAVIDPNWGEPKPHLTTIRATPEEAIEAALADDSLRLYSGASFMCVPPIKGRWDLLYSYGYRVAKVAVGIIEINQEKL